MKVKQVIEITAESYLEEQNIMGRFPDAIWIKLDENRTKFYINKDKERDVEMFLQEMKKFYGKQK
jgi:hypothetical protein